MEDSSAFFPNFFGFMNWKVIYNGFDGADDIFHRDTPRI
jgi:hypothetical protein